MEVFRSAIFLVRSSFWPSRSAILASRLAISSLACSAAALASCSVLTSVAVTFSSLFDRPSASVVLVSRVFSRVSLTFFCSLSWSSLCTTSSDSCLILASALRCSSTALAWRIKRPTPSAMHRTTNTTIPVLLFITFKHARSGKVWQARISALNYGRPRLDSIHGIAARGSGHDAAQRHPLSTSDAAALHFRAALSADAVRRPQFAPDVFGGDAETRAHTRDSVQRGRPRIDPRFGGAQGRHLEPRPARHRARGIGGNGQLQAVSRESYPRAGIYHDGQCGRRCAHGQSAGTGFRTAGTGF